MKSFAIKILNFLARAYVKRYKPMVIAITGNIGKTSAKEAIGAVLKAHEKNVRVSGGNLNNEFGIPLTIIGDYSEDYYSNGGTLSFWLKVMFRGLLGFLFFSGYPKILVLEYGSEKPGDIQKLVHDYPPHISVVTAVGDIPVHVEFFKNSDELAKEKRQLISRLKENNIAVLNFDDEIVMDMASHTKAKIVTFGFGDGATVKVSNFDTRTDENSFPEGISFKFNHGDSTFVPVKINNAIGRAQALASAAAAAVGAALGMNLVAISEALASYEPQPGRMRILRGIKNSIIIDDTYNASPSAVRSALETIRELPAKGRRIAVLGDMLELGSYTIEAHENVGALAGSAVDLLITVGDKAKLMADGAKSRLIPEHIHSFENSTEAKAKIQELISEGDIILIKGSQATRMERIVEEIMAEPQRARELLVRQSDKWRAK